MDENISGQIRLGVSVILVAALVAVVLSLMATSQSIMGSGVSSLQGGVDQITVQEFERYNGQKISGTDVKAAMSLYLNRDIALIVRTKACVSKAAMSEKNNSQFVWGYNYGAILESSMLVNTNSQKPLYGLIWGSGNAAPLVKKAGDSHYTMNRQVSSGIIQSSNNTEATLSTGSSTYILESARFLCELIKDETGEIIGICFTQQI